MSNPPVHWADQTARRVISERGDKAEYVVASGITPSGTVHIGNFREVITVDLVARALESLGKKVKFIYSWDDFDTFRKVPSNLDDPKAFEKYLRQPINRVPDPRGQEESYARGNEVIFEKELVALGIKPLFIYQSQAYENNRYAEGIRTALENKDKIREILNKHRSKALAKDWLPTAIYCEACGRDEMQSESYAGDWNYQYTCASCSHSATTDIRQTKNLKLNWRTDWPMRWAYEKVDFEPGGKDHSSEGGSYDTGKVISQEIYDWKAPSYQQYDFVSIKGLNGKMSSSKGNVISISSALEVYSPQMVRWIFAAQRPNHDFSLAFDEDVIKVYDEFDKAEQQALSEPPKKLGRWPQIRRTYELSLTDPESIPATPPPRASFRALCNRLQLCDGQIDRVWERFYAAEFGHEHKDSFYQRSTCAWNWLQKHAPESFQYNLLKKRADESSLTQLEKDQLLLLRNKIMQDGFLEQESTQIGDEIFQNIIKANELDPKSFYGLVYMRLIGRAQGPRLPSFLQEIGRERLLELL